MRWILRWLLGTGTPCSKCGAELVHDAFGEGVVCLDCGHQKPGQDEE